MIVAPIDHVDLGISRLLHQWKDKPIITGLLISFLEQLDYAEGTLFQLNNERGIYTAIGEQLNVIGALFNLPRAGLTDTEYRSVILRRIALTATDGTTEEFMKILRLVSGSNYVDFWEHDSGDVHALIGEGATFATYNELEDTVPAGVRVRVYVDDKFDSFMGSELLEIAADLQTHLGEDLQTHLGEDIQVQYREVSTINSDLAVLPEIADPYSNPYFAELLFTTVRIQTGDLIDYEGNHLVDFEGNNIVWIDYIFDEAD